MSSIKFAGIYIHIPFCLAKCGYCDFYSITDLDGIALFIESLKTEIDHYKHLANSNVIFDTIYIGGGTPSILDPGNISGILEKLTRSFSFNSKSEVTIEINPGTVDKNIFSEYIRFGINRLSIGVQSFSESELRYLGRIHDVNDAKTSIEKAREAGFNNISLDLIYAMPGQTMASWEDSLLTTIKLYPEHISAYNLTFEKGTPFYNQMKNGEIIKPSNEEEADFFNFTHNYLSEAGYQHYEVSSFARSALNMSQHNRKYWNHTPYLSFGPSAHSFWQNKRWQNIRSVEKYISIINSGKMPVESAEELDNNTLMFEQIYLGLRTYAGIDLNKFRDDFEKDFKLIFITEINDLIKNDFAVIEDNYFRLTHKGMLYCDEITPKFSI